MKKIIIALAVLFAVASTANADNSKPITLDQLPNKSQQFIKKHFPNDKVSFAKVERDFMETCYEVIFVSNVKVEFFKNGEWKEVDCKSSEIPGGIAPQQIVNQVKERYAGVKITEINKDSRDYEVKLSNGLEMTFDLKYRLVDIDD